MNETKNEHAERKVCACGDVFYGPAENCGDHAKTRHTPGPWTTMRTPDPQLRKDAPSTILTAHGSEREVVARVVGPNAVANAHLIAAAPALLEALEAVEALAVECDRCDATGRDPSSSVEFPDACRRCAGVGEYVPTAGPELLTIRAALRSARGE